MRQDCHRAPLDCPYSGPYRVLSRTDKFFTLDLNSRVDTVSIDRLKPAFLEEPQVTPSPPPPPPPLVPATTPPAEVPIAVPTTTPTDPLLTTRSGRIVQAPSRLNL